MGAGDREVHGAGGDEGGNRQQDGMEWPGSISGRMGTRARAELWGFIHVSTGGLGLDRGSDGDRGSERERRGEREGGRRKGGMEGETLCN